VAELLFDGWRGSRVGSSEAGVTTAFIGNYFEWSASDATAMKKYYYAAGVRVVTKRPIMVLPQLS